MRTICVVTGSRAEYGLLFPLLREIKSDSEMRLQLVVTGMHLSPEFGYTYRQILEDGFIIDDKVEMLLSSDTPIGITKSMGVALLGFADVFNRLKPDIIVLLGDRYEIMAAAQAAMIAKIPIAHLHGGESTEGALDEAIRHSITKMSQLHYVSTETYRKRVIQLGEQPDRVFNVGAIGLDNIRSLQLLSKSEFEQAIDFRLGERNFLVTYHPVTLHERDSEQLVRELLLALDHFDDAKIIFTKPNSDTDGRIIGQLIDHYVQSHPGRAAAYYSLGTLRYLSALQHVDVVIGNSSSGIIEAPAFRKPTVNIGNRQKGRIKGRSIIEAEEHHDAIKQAISTALDPHFIEANVKCGNHVYGDGMTAPRIKQSLKTVNLEGILQKAFYDVGWQEDKI
ncbi:UDP-N-acetylglucosamine 2-epimerase (hydrolyzing) [Paenibacillus nanensis]|uniref:UDP-N-acetylglucosamine 2-epimerase (Hydrolyzing) n=1 Tax=Paenibacillus nanensis TaxID=393251 RepID=A0A3A1UKW4_9BACL|nr:UDP-N-acetylglucosamine 2-epimerase [Paenibacillus nanensis]RIX47309.1 UDP-N-acetylglucosamine 2-epimerase (hydrolyzing) [Paenibacillus nanensis]